MVKYHYMSKVTGEIHENIWEVIEYVYDALVYGFPEDVPLSTYIKYVFLWSYSKEGF